MDSTKGDAKKKPVEFLRAPLVIINLGLAKFAEELKKQGVDVVHVDWTPPAGGDREMLDLLDRLL